MIKTFIPLRMFRTLPHRQLVVEIGSHLQSIEHFILGISGMNITPLDCYLGSGSIKILVLQFPFKSAVHRIGEISTKAFYIEKVHPAPDFLIRRKPDTDFPVFDFRMSQQILRSRHNLGHPGFIVRPQ